MEICSLSFLVFSIGVVIVFHLLPWKRSRQTCLALVNFLFLALVVPNRLSWIWLIALVGTTYAALRLLPRWPRRGLLGAWIGFALVVFLYLRRNPLIPLFVPVDLFWDEWWDLWHQPIVVVGLSYMLFKFVHMLVDQWQGQLAPFSLSSYVNYQLSFFTLIAGPIQRYNDFHRYWEEMDLEPADARGTLLSWNRLLAGLLKMSVLAVLAARAFDFGTARLQSAPVPFQAYLICFYAYPAYLYFNFSGYTDAVIGCAGLLGFGLPENFNRPYLARNVLDFWNRWHISLTHWIRDYIFMTSYKAAASRFPQGARYWSYFLLFVALFAVGLWHGVSSAFVWFGVLNGLGAAVAQAYGDALRSLLGRTRFQDYLKSAPVRLLAILVTFHYVCFCLLIFSSGPGTARAMLSAAGRRAGDLSRILPVYQWCLGAGAAAAVAALLAAVANNAETIERRLAGVALLLTGSSGRLYRWLFAQAMLLVLLFCVRWAYQTDPPPVLYMRF